MAHYEASILRGKPGHVHVEAKRKEIWRAGGMKENKRGFASVKVWNGTEPPTAATS